MDRACRAPPLAGTVVAELQAKEEFMAEIHVEKKRGVSPIVWILVLLVAAALAWLIYSMSVAESTPEPVPATTTTASLVPAPERFLAA